MKEKLPEITGKPLFSEEQRLRDSWIWYVLWAEAAFFVAMVLVVCLDKNTDTTEKLVVPVIFVTVFSAGMLLVSAVRFESAITTTGIFYRWKPFSVKYHYLALPAVADAGMRTINTLQIGRNKMKGYGTVHYLGGKKGVQLHLKNGEMLFMGTRRPDDMERALKRMKELQS